MALLPSHFFTLLVDLLAEVGDRRPEGVLNNQVDLDQHLDLYTRTDFSEVRRMLGEVSEPTSTNNRSRR